jgi:hypothetical protein
MGDVVMPTEEELAAEPVDDLDVELLRQIAGIYDQLDPVPAGLVDRISFGITLDALHAEVAQLVRGGSLVGARSDSTTDSQTVTFTSSALTTMVTVAVIAADRVRIDGWIAPGAGVGVEIRTEAGSRTTVADEDGRFAADDVPRGFVQFVLTPPADSGIPPVITPSIEV